MHPVPLNVSTTASANPRGSARFVSCTTMPLSMPKTGVDRPNVLYDSAHCESSLSVTLPCWLFRPRWDQPIFSLVRRSARMQDPAFLPLGEL
eukprot:7389891-Prymnesium_polylepis.1